MMSKRSVISLIGCLIIILYGVMPHAYAESKKSSGGLTVSGFKTPAGKAYASYYNAIMSGDLTEVRSVG